MRRQALPLHYWNAIVEKSGKTESRYTVCGACTATACGSGGSTFCDKVPYAQGCVDSNGFYCTCEAGFTPEGNNQSSTCVGKSTHEGSGFMTTIFPTGAY